MKRFRSCLIIVAALALIAAAPPKTGSASAIIARFASAWNNLRSYTCTWSVHEVKGTRVQDRMYHIFFQKPLNTRAEVVAGDGKGSAAVWTGGDRVRGHQGGFLSLIRMTLGVNNRLAVSLRGATISQVNMGWLLSHLQSIGVVNFAVTQQGVNSVLTARVQEPSPDADVVREVYVFAPSGLPLEGSQYGEHDVVLKHVVYSDYQLNPVLPSSTWQI